MILLNTFLLYPELIFIIKLESILWALRIFSLDRKNLISLTLNSYQEGRKIKIRNYLWHSFVCTVQVIPHSINFPQWKPMVWRITDESNLISKIFVGFDDFNVDHLQVQWFQSLYITIKITLQDLNWIIPIVGYVPTLLLHVFNCLFGKTLLKH